ncbi:MAG: GTPase ObgE [Clostridia bacterium]|nr:GTPase ObgE [Clostridia bacterium]
MFLDVAKIKIQAGNGGNGKVSFIRTKMTMNGGPDGGNGGKGGDVYFIAKNNLNTLYEFKFKTKFKADNGLDGESNNKAGKHGKDLYIAVPVGTIIKDASSGNYLADLLEENSSVKVLRGGKGGRGNTFYANATRQAPHFSQGGEKTQQFEIILELKTIADVGLVGYPNVGKSTLLSTITNARPKIANYHFTTLTPNLGVVEHHGNTFVIADIPGLIEGASDGAGLGYQFLKHVERVRVILHMVDISGIEERKPFEDYIKINKELEKYSKILAKLPQIIVLTKIDLIDEENLKEKTEEFKTKLKKELKDKKILSISAITNRGLEELKNEIWQLLEKTPKPEPAQIEPFVLDERDTRSIQIQKEGDNIFRVSGGLIEEIARSVILSDMASLAYFQKRLKNDGILDKLHEAGAVDGDTIRIKDAEFILTD